MKLVLLCCLLLQPLPAQLLPRVDIAGIWKITEADDPKFSRPDFDDSSWQPIQLPHNFFVSGDEEVRYFWLRRKVDLDAAVAAHHLTLTLGKLSENYELFVNGAKVARVGTFDRAGSQLARPRSFDLPPLAAGRLTIAIRLFQHNYDGASSWRRLADPGPYLLTDTTSAPRDAGSNYIRSLQLAQSAQLASGVSLLAIASILVLIYLSNRSRTELLWYALSLVASAETQLMTVSSIRADSTPWASDLALLMFWYPLLLAFTAKALEVRPPVWWMILWPLAAVPQLTSVRLPLLRSVLGLLAGLVLVWILLRVKRWYGPNIVIAAASGLLYLAQLASTLSALGSSRPMIIPIGAYNVPVPPVLGGIVGLVMVLVLTRRLLADRAEKQRLSAELEAARSVQSLLLANAVEDPAGYSLEVAYTPAQEVGGDFYKVLDGNLLITGDVSGKGLRAAMLVSLLLGVLRETRERQPHAVLTALNRAVAGQADMGFVTCCCLRLDADGTCTIANAGHPAPWVDGSEVELTPGLPLGLDTDTEYDEREIQLPPGAQLTVVSDGVIEAANVAGELFGFERTAAISGKPAKEIANAAQSWGQNDDITVVTVRRLP